MKDVALTAAQHKALEVIATFHGWPLVIHPPISGAVGVLADDGTTFSVDGKGNPEAVQW